MTSLIPFIPRIGPVDYAPPFAKSAVQFLDDGRIKLSLIKGRNPDGSPKWYGAGLFGPHVAPGRWTFVVEGDLPSLNPAAVFAIWFHNENDCELDVVEVSRWNNPNAEDNMRSTLWVGTDLREQFFDFSGRGFTRYKFVCQIHADRFELLPYGEMPDGSWKELTDWWTGPLTVDVAQLRIGLYVLRGDQNPNCQLQGRTVDTQGPRSVILESATFEGW